MSCNTTKRYYIASESLACKDNSISNITICNNDLLYLVDHCYNVIGDEKLKSVMDRLLLSALNHN